MRSVCLLLAACHEVVGLAAGGALRSGAPVVRALSPQMVAVPAVNFDGASVGEKPVELKVAKSGAYLIHRKVVAEQANMRLGTANTKTRSEVRGGGRKPYQQKGTGRARQGSIRSPLKVGGGVLFGPKPKSFKIKMNRKEKKLALSTALMSATPKMTLLEDFEDKFSAPRTNDMKVFLDRLNVNTVNREGTLMIIKSRHENTYLSARNIPYLNLITLDNLNARNIPYLNLITLDNLNARDIVKAKKVFVSTSALETLTERYGA